MKQSKAFVKISITNVNNRRTHNFQFDLLYLFFFQSNTCTMILKNVMNSIFKATYIRGFYVSVVNLWLAKSIVDSDCNSLNTNSKHVGN